MIRGVVDSTPSLLEVGADMSAEEREMCVRRDAWIEILISGGQLFSGLWTISLPLSSITLPGQSRGRAI